jgi:hypothetical protein
MSSFKPRLGDATSPIPRCVSHATLPGRIRASLRDFPAPSPPIPLGSHASRVDAVASSLMRPGIAARALSRTMRKPGSCFHLRTKCLAITFMASPTSLRGRSLRRRISPSSAGLSAWEG